MNQRGHILYVVYVPTHNHEQQAIVFLYLDFRPCERRYLMPKTRTKNRPDFHPVFWLNGETFAEVLSLSFVETWDISVSLHQDASVMIFANTSRQISCYYVICLFLQFGSVKRVF